MNVFNFARNQTQKESSQVTNQKSNDNRRENYNQKVFGSV
jgi:hypothetical protein